MSRSNDYNGGLAREQFLVYEIRIVAKLVREGESREDEYIAAIKDKLMGLLDWIVGWQ